MNTTNILVLEPRATFGHGVAIDHAKRTGLSAAFTFCKTNLDICRRLAENEGDIAVVPLENNLAGLVPEWLRWCREEMLRGDSRLEIVKEIIEPIEQKLLARHGVKKENITTVISHERAIRQCSKLLSSMDVKVLEVSSTAAAAAMVAESRDEDGLAALGAKAAAIEYGLNIICDKADDEIGNITRFGIVRKRDTTQSASISQTGPIRSMVVFDLPNAVGALHQVTLVLLEHLANMTSLRDLPQGLANRYSYSFYLEYEIDSSKARACLQALRGVTKNLVQFGSFGVERGK